MNENNISTSYHELSDHHCAKACDAFNLQLMLLVVLRTTKRKAPQFVRLAFTFFLILAWLGVYLRRRWNWSNRGGGGGASRGTTPSFGRQPAPWPNPSHGRSCGYCS